MPIQVIADITFAAVFRFLIPPLEAFLALGAFGRPALTALRAAMMLLMQIGQEEILTRRGRLRLSDNTENAALKEEIKVKKWLQNGPVREKKIKW